LKLKYSPDSRDKLKSIKTEFGYKNVKVIMDAINGLSDNPRKCPSIEKMLGISCPYFYLHIQHFCVFYRIDEDVIYVVDIYNEHEDFMWKMFGIKLRTQESIDYWGE
jgi:mRNA-degrading endonuclease RelE of RelBE toxin-antitoxin system